MSAAATGIWAKAASWRIYALLALTFALPCLAGKLTPYLLLLIALIGFATPNIVRDFRSRSRNPIDLMFPGVFLIMGAVYAIDATTPVDYVYLLTFLPLLIALPVRWQMERFARADGLSIIARLSLAGAGFAVLVAAFQVVILGYPRAGEDWLNAIQFADTAVLLGFMALVGFFAPGQEKKAIFLLGPVLGIAAALLAGTRGALIAVPVLGALVLVMAMIRAERKALLLGIAGAVIAVLVIAVFVSMQFNLLRALDFSFLGGDASKPGKPTLNILARLDLWTAAWEAFKASPWLGYGWGHMLDAVHKFAAPGSSAATAQYGHLHNGFFNFAVSAGVVGLACYAVLLATPIVAVLRARRDAQFAGRLFLALTLVAGYFIFELTNVMFGYEFHTTLYGFICVAILAFAQSPPSIKSEAGHGQLS